jgi:NADPH-dependent F420 reductase
VQFAGVGHQVVVGSRALERARETVDELQSRWPDRRLSLEPSENAGAADAEMVVLATPWDGLPATLAPLADAVAGKIVISMANALARWGQDMVPLLVPTGSVTVAVARALPAARVVGAFHHLPAGPWSDLDTELQADVLVCSDDRSAASEVVRLIDELPGLRGVEAGGLASALAIEALTPALLEVNRRYRAHVAFRLTGLDAESGRSR